MTDLAPVEREDVAEGRKNVGELVDFFRLSGSLRHCTPTSNLLKIYRSGFIEPNIKGRFPNASPNSTHSLARCLNAISLFDFRSRPIEEILIQSMKWRGMFEQQNWVVIEINSTALDQTKLIPTWDMSHEEKKRIATGGGIPTHFPSLEVCYQGAIPVSSFVRCIRVRKVAPFDFEQVHATEFAT